MTQQFNSMPTFQTPLETNGVTSRPWYFFLSGLFRGLPPQLENQVPPTGSPFSYIAPVRGFLIVHGGTVSDIEFSRDGSTFYNLGVTAGQITLAASDTVVITYSLAPTLTFVPT